MAPKAKAPALDYDGPMDGSGNFFFPDGASYSGSWKMVIPDPEDAVDGVLKPKRVRHGNGRFQDGDNVYVGSFQEDLFDGDGTFTFASGSIYSGMWKQGRYCGQVQATIKLSPGPMHVQYNCKYSDFLPSCVPGSMYTAGLQGKYEWPDGWNYQGEFVDNVPHGDGTYTDQEGRSWSGKFRKGSGPGLIEKLA